MEYRGVIAGLGNPGARYAGTRHNCGFDFVDALLDMAAAEGDVLQLSGHKFSCELWRVRLPELHGWWLATRPLTFMNLSGQCIQPLLAWYKLSADDLLVVHDELDIPPGDIRFKKGGGNAGHNGLKSITECLGTADFYRLRLGIGRPQNKSAVIDWVLGRPDAADAENLQAARLNAMQILFIFADKGLESAQQAQKCLRKSKIPQRP
ncbi:MAG: aminoacyl-tRNA hydrolase [Desulfovibrio sp.]|nr:aminoacyl-tRNA hydrolase [Desulfovibrio sp.]